MTDHRTLVTGATGAVGGATMRALQAAGAEPTAFVRDPDRAARVLGEQTPLRVGDIGDEGSLRRALDGIDAVLLCSSHGPEMRECQLAAVRAIEAGGPRRVVKISASPVSLVGANPAQTGVDHLAVEDAMRASGLEAIAVRPNAFMQNFLDQADAVGYGALPGPQGEPRVSFIDAEDIGRVAAAALLAEPPPEPVLEPTGPEALTWFDAAATMTEVLGRPVQHYPTPPDIARQALLAMGRPEWLVDHLLELGALMSESTASEITDTVERTTGRAPTTLSEFLTEHAADFPPAPEA